MEEKEEEAGINGHTKRERQPEKGGCEIPLRGVPAASRGTN